MILDGERIKGTVDRLGDKKKKKSMVCRSEKESFCLIFISEKKLILHSTEVFFSSPKLPFKIGRRGGEYEGILKELIYGGVHALKCFLQFFLQP